MRIEADAVLRHRREAVFTAYRDEIASFVEYLPNVRLIEVVERVEEGHLYRMHNVGHGTTELPAGLTHRLEDRFLTWDDYAVWDASTYTCEWTIEPHSLREAVVCRGRCDFIDLGGGRTRMEMTGELAIELERVRGVPSFLAESLGRTALGRAVETLLVRQVTTNLTSVSDALAAYLSADTVA